MSEGEEVKRRRATQQAGNSRISGIMETAQKSNRQCDNPRHCSQTSAALLKH
jgi:hypothetical protein